MFMKFTLVHNEKTSLQVKFIQAPGHLVFKKKKLGVDFKNTKLPLQIHTKNWDYEDVIIGEKIIQKLTTFVVTLKAEKVAFSK